MALVPGSLQIDIFVTNIPKDPKPMPPAGAGSEGQKPDSQHESKPQPHSWTPAKFLKKVHAPPMSHPSTSMEDVSLDSNPRAPIHLALPEEKGFRNRSQVSVNDDYNTLLVHSPCVGPSDGRYGDVGLKGKDHECEAGVGNGGHRQEDSEYDVLDYTHFDGDLDAEVVPAEESLSRILKEEGTARRRITRRVTTGYRSRSNSPVDPVRQVTSPQVAVIPEEHTNSSPPSPLHGHGTGEGDGYLQSSHLDFGEPTTTEKQTPRTSLPQYLQQYELKLRDPIPPRGKRADRASENSIRDPIVDLSAVQSMMPKTGKGARGEEMEIHFSEEELEDILAMTEYTWPGRPSLDKLLREEVEVARGPIVVACGCFLPSFIVLIRTYPLTFFIGCGPTSLSASIRKIVAAQIDPLKIKAGDMRGYISCVTEEFEY